jgi:ligand-binding sensor domain-containing protein
VSRRGTGAVVKNNEWVKQTLWGAAWTLGAALALGSASLPNLRGALQDRHEFPVVRAQEPSRQGGAPRERAAALPLDRAVEGPLRLRLREAITDPDDTRAAVDGAGALWVATGGGLLRVPHDGGPSRWWTTADGLPDHRLTAIARVGEGLALGTEGGAVVLIALADEPTVIASGHVGDVRVSDLLVADGQLYAATWGEGVLSAPIDELDNWRPLGPTGGVKARQVTSLAWLDGELLAGTAGAGLWVRSADGKSRRYVAKGGLAHDFVLDLQEHDGRVYAATPAGVSRYRSGAIETRRGGEGVPAGLVRALGVDPREGGGVVLAMAGGRIGDWGSDRAQPLPPHPDGLGPWNGIPAAEVRWVMEAGGSLWAGTDRGLAVRAPGGWRWRLHDGPGSNDLTTVVARDGLLFAGSFDRGGRVLDGAWQPMALSSGEVNDALIDDGGRVWVATSGGLARWEAGALTTFGPLHGLPSAHVAALAEADGGLFVGTTAGVSLFDGVGFSPLGGGADVHHVYALSGAGDSAFAGTIGGLFQVRRGGARAFRYETGELPDNWINAVVQGADGSLWAGTYDHGLALRRPDGSWRRLGEDDGLPNGWVNPGAMAALPDGSVLVGTLGGGLLRVTPDGGVDRWTTTDGLAGDDVTDVCVDGATVWVATRSGLSRVEVTRAPGDA